MATQIQIKRGASGSNTAPGQLAAGELGITYGSGAQDNGGDRLYIGNSNNSANLTIGGKYFADLLDHVHGTLTASSAVIADSNSKLDNIKVDNIDLNGNAITTTNTNGDLDITPHGTGIVNFKGDGSSADGAIKIFCSQNTHGITIKSPAHSAAATYTLTLPVNNGNANNMLTTDGSGVLAWAATVSGTTGTFSGAISATTGTFSSNISSTGSTAGNVRVGVTTDNKIDTSTGGLTIDSNSGTTTIDDNLTISASKTIDMGANKVTNIADPTAAQDAASKAYVDAVKTGLDIKDSCTVATTADVSSWTYANGTAGVGATLTASGNGVVALDSVNLALNMRVLVKDQSPATENGIYYVSTAGAGGATLVLTRALDANQPAELTGGSFTFVEQGTTQAENGYVFTHNGEPTFGSGNTDLTVAQFSGAGQVIAGTGLTKSGNTINVVGSTTIRANADTLEVKSTNVAGQVLRSTGTANAAAVYGQLDLANSLAVTGIAAVPNGGTGVNTIGANQLMTGDGANPVNLVPVGTSGMVLLSAGSGTDPSFGHVDGGTF